MKPERLTGAVVKTVTPYTNEGMIDFEGFCRYVSWAVSQGAQSMIVPSDVGDYDHLSFNEKTKLVRVAKEAAGENAAVIATLMPGDESITDQINAYALAGADGYNIRYPGADDDTLKQVFAEAVWAGAEFIVLQDFKAGGFDMNRGGNAAGISEDLILELLEKYGQFKSLMISLPLNLTGSKCSSLKKKAGDRINIIADTATDQFLEQIDRGAEGFTTGILISQFNNIYNWFVSGKIEEARNLFFEILRAIVWTKQYVDREPYFYQRYLQKKGLISMISFRTDRYIDEYMIRYGEEMLAIAEETEK
ncbi:MAG: dihydrodipicolinate synthase family protein [Erysipelotrichaceae bacterium]|nr:dihydrodipicolinate synthase family protein [Erysipelotrichaceae bacterium]